MSLFSSFLMLLPFCARTDNLTYSFDVQLCRGNLVFWALTMCFSWSVACNPHYMKLRTINLLFNLTEFKCFLVAWPLVGTLPTKAYNILRFISWLVNSCGGWFLACPWPPPSTCCSSFIIEEVPGGHMASCFSLMLSACFVDVNGEHSPSQWFFFFSFCFIFFFPGKGEVVLCSGMQLEKSACTSGPAICILSQSLHSVAAKALFPGLTLNSCLLHPSLMPSSDFHILLIPSCWFSLQTYFSATFRLFPNVKYQTSCCRLWFPLPNRIISPS